MNKVLFVRRRLQAGVSLLEMALALALLGVMGIAAWSVLQGARQSAATQVGTVYVQQTADALYGYVLQNKHLPPPLEAATGLRPGYSEGWLPDLGIPSARKVRYLVNTSLTEVPKQIYQADPLGLAGAGIDKRTDVNLLDFCLALIREEKKSTSLPGGMRLGFGVQEAASAASTAGAAGAVGAARGFWLSDGAAGDLPAGLEVTTVTSGYLELAGRLGCFDKLARLSSGVKSAAAIGDMVKLAEQGVSFRALDVKSAEESLLNVQWRYINWSIGVGMFALDWVLVPVQMEEGLPGMISAGANLAGLALIIAGTGVFIEQSKAGIVSAKEWVAASQTALADAKTYRQSMLNLQKAALDEVNRLQHAGDKP